MPVYFHEVPRPVVQKRPSKFGLVKLAFINVAVLSVIAGLWLARPPQPTPARRSATIQLVPATPPSASPVTQAATERARPAMADPLPVSTVTPAPAPPSSGFREVERAASGGYVGFRENAGR